MNWIRILLLPMMVAMVLQEHAAAQDSFWQRIQCRHNLETKKEIAQPAFFQVTAGPGFLPKIAAGVGVKIDLVSEDDLQIGPFGEVLWNTDIAKVQKNIRAGLDGDWFVGRYGSIRFTPMLKMQVNYRNDYVTGVIGGQAAAFVTASFRNTDYPLPNTTWTPFGEVVDIQYSPMVGIMLDNIVKADVPGRVGPIWRASAQVDILLRPFAESLEGRIELTGSFAYRGDVTDPTSEADNDHPYYKYGITWYPVKDDSAKVAAGIGLSYVDGEDPTKGFEHQQYGQFGITLKAGF